MQLDSGSLRALDSDPFPIPLPATAVSVGETTESCGGVERRSITDLHSWTSFECFLHVAFLVTFSSAGFRTSARAETDETGGGVGAGGAGTGGGEEEGLHYVAHGNLSLSLLKCTFFWLQMRTKQ